MDVDLAADAQKRPDFLAMNSFDQVPVIQDGEVTLANVTNYNYASCAPEDNVSLADYLQLPAWLARMEALPRFLPVVKSPIGLAV